MRRALKGWDGPVWYPEKAVITLTDPDSGDTIKAMNPAHILYELETNRDWGRGKPAARLDDMSFRTAADQLHSEGLGLCLRWVRTDSIDSFAGSVLDHIAGNLFTSRTTGLRKLTLVRSDYAVEDLPHFTPESGLLEIQEDDNSASADAANEVVVTWRNPVDNSKRQARERNLAAIRAAGGRVISVQTEYLGLPTYELGARIAKRDLRAKVSAKRWKLVLDRRGRDIEPGAAFRFSAPSRGLSNIVVRAGRVDEGALGDGRITITAVLDVFGMPSTTFSTVPPSGWVPPLTTPQAVNQCKLSEVTWRELVQAIDPANLGLLDPSAGYIGILASRPNGLSLGYYIQSKVGGAEFVTRRGGDFCPSALIGGHIALGSGHVTVALAGGTDLDLVRPGSAAMVDDEILRVEALDLTSMSVTLARACVDTVPSEHATGARIWFFDDYAGRDTNPYSAGTSVDVRLLTNTSSGILDPSLAPISSLVMAQRANRPYPPGLLMVNGTSYPSVALSPLTVAWAHRDRLLQADQLVDSSVGNIGPEPGTTYSARLVAQDNGIVLASHSGISATAVSLSSSYEGAVTLELWSVRGGLESRYRHRVPLVLQQAEAVGFAAAVLSFTPACWLRLGESVGTTALDASGNGRNGTYSSDASALTTPGLLVDDSDTAISFTAQLVRLSLPVAPVVSGGRWTFGCLARPLSPPTQSGIGVIFQIGSAGSGCPELDIVDQGNGQFSMRVMYSGQSMIFSTTTTWSYDSLCVIYLRQTDTGIQLFVNGQLVGNTSSTWVTYGGETRIGYARFGSDSYPLIGVLDEIQFYAEALSDEQIASLTLVAAGSE